VSVKFFRLDKQRIDQALRRYAAGLAEDPRVLAVILFGSLARGDATGTSDADVVIILHDSPEPFHDRIPEYLRPGVGISMDVFPYTLQEALRAAREGWGVVRAALREGRWLLDRAGVRECLAGALAEVSASAVRVPSG